MLGLIRDNRYVGLRYLVKVLLSKEMSIEKSTVLSVVKLAYIKLSCSVVIMRTCAAQPVCSDFGGRNRVTFTGLGYESRLLIVSTDVYKLTGSRLYRSSKNRSNELITVAFIIIGFVFGFVFIFRDDPMVVSFAK